MKKATRAAALASAVILAASTLVGCSPYNNPGKYISVPDKGTVSIKKEDIDKEYQEDVDSILEDNRETEYTKLTDSDATVKDGDQVNIYYVGEPIGNVKLSDDTLSGMKYTKDSDDEGSDSTGYDLVIGSGTFIGAYTSTDDSSKNTKGFEEQLIGAKAGGEVLVNVTFPSDYDTEELQNVAVKFTVTINSISRAYVNDDTTITVSYEFINSIANEDSDDTSASETAGKSRASAASDTSETTEDNNTDSSSKIETPEDTKSFEDIFTSGTFTYDFTDAEGEKDSKFFTFLKTADYVAEFKGKEINTEITVKVTVPEDAGDTFKDYLGKEVEMKLTVTKINHLPEWNDDFVAKYTSDTYKTVDEYKDYAWNLIAQNNAFTAINEKTEVISYPQKQLKAAYENYVYQSVYTYLGNKAPTEFTAAELAEKISDEKYEEIYSSSAVSAKASIKQRLVIEYLCKYYDVSLTNDEYKTMLNEEFTNNMYTYVYSYGIYSVDSLETLYGKEYFDLQFRATKLMEHLTDYVVIE